MLGLDGEEVYAGEAASDQASQLHIMRSEILAFCAA